MFRAFSLSSHPFNRAGQNPDDLVEQFDPLLNYILG